MIVCVCEGVSDREVRGAIARGADSLAALEKATKVGRDCGCCHPDLLALLREHRLGHSARACAGAPAPPGGHSDG